MKLKQHDAHVRRYQKKVYQDAFNKTRRISRPPGWQRWHWQRAGFASLMAYQEDYRRKKGVRPMAEYIKARWEDPRREKKRKSDLGHLQATIEYLRKKILDAPKREAALERKRAYSRTRWTEKGAARRLELHPPGYEIHLDLIYRLALKRSEKRKRVEREALFYTIDRLKRGGRRRGSSTPEVAKLRRRLRRYFEKAFHTGSRSARFQELLGCTLEEAKVYLEKQFKPGMTWKNHSFRGWHIDHKRPLASFDLTDVEQQKPAFHYTNLQPLWARENLSKNAKW